MSGIGSFDSLVLENDPVRRRFVLELLTAALGSLDPGEAVKEALRRQGDELHFAGTSVDLSEFDRIIVLGVGKASVAMAGAVEEIITDRTLEGIVVTPDAGASLPRLVIAAGNHPVPGADSLAAGRRLLEVASTATPADLVLVLISGGGSALAEVPAAGLTLDDLAGLTDLLLGSGAAIEEVNTVRRQLSAIKGGRLGAAAGGARLLTLIASDVVGDPPGVIASGPTVPDPGTAADALAVLERYGVVDRVPPAVITHLLAGEAPVNGITRQAMAVVLNGSKGADAICRAAAQRGVEAKVVTTTLVGEARVVGLELAAVGRALERPGLLVYAGETTVTVSGDGTGGRNQELALAAAIGLEGESEVVLASFATDGVDGPTDAAGAIVDGHTVARSRAAGVDPQGELEENNAYPTLALAGDLLRCGATGTNVGDLVVVYRSRAGAG